MTSVLAMPLAWSILLVSQQDIDHVYSAIVPIIQSLYGSFKNQYTTPRTIGLLLQSGNSLKTRKLCKVQNLQSKSRWVLKRLKP